MTYPRTYPSRLTVALLAALALASTAASSHAKGRAKPPRIKNVILLVGDGMQLEHEIATSRYLRGSDYGMLWHWAWFRSPVSTWDVTAYNTYAALLGVAPYDASHFDPIVGYDPARGGDWPFPVSAEQDSAYLLSSATDSASAATAWATGHKTDGGNIAWASGDPADGALTTLAEYMRAQRGAAIGVVSTVPFTHATPAAHVAHNVNRNNYGAIADEIIKVFQPEVVIGGGAPVPNTDGTQSYTPYLPQAQYEALKTNSEYVLAERTPGVDGNESIAAAASLVNLGAGQRLFGLYGGVNGNFESPVPSDSPGAPSVARATVENPLLAEASVAALDVLAQDRDGFFLMIEQGDIDWANHDNDFARMVGCTWDLERALKAVLAHVSRPGDDVTWGNTIVIVTSDHSNSHLRLETNLGKGDLPTQVRKATGHVCPTGEHCGAFLYPDRDVTYSTGNHTNELVMLYAYGQGIAEIRRHAGAWYPGTSIIDNTHIFTSLATLTGLTVD